ncbi:MAG: helix-turn-helix domain-containing protein [Nocardioides sp.]
MADPNRALTHDPTRLRAIAHPVRNRILSELSASGPLRAADVARDLDIPANQASFHLRQLAKYGLVEEDPTAARDRRDRVWRATESADMDINLTSVEETPGGQSAIAVFRRSKAAWGHHVVDRAYSEDREPDTVRSIIEHSLKLTKAEAEDLADEVSALIEGWADRTRGRDDARRTYLLLSVLQPYPAVGPGAS